MLSVMLVLCLVMVLGACSQSDNVYELGEDEDVVEEEYSEDEELALLKEGPTDENNDGFFILRNGENYNLSGVCRNEYASGDKRLLYENIMDIGNGLRGFYSVGYVPVPVLQERDLIVCYSNERVPVMWLSRVSSYGYTIGTKYYDNSKELYYYNTGTSSCDLVYKKNVSNPTIIDLDDNAVEDDFNLNEDEIYDLSWYEGTQHEEVSLPANCEVYVFDSSEFEKDYEIEGTLTKDGYAQYDLSDVSAGTYKISTGPGGVWQGLITIE